MGFILGAWISTCKKTTSCHKIDSLEVKGDNEMSQTALEHHYYHRTSSTFSNKMSNPSCSSCMMTKPKSGHRERMIVSDAADTRSQVPYKAPDLKDDLLSNKWSPVTMTSLDRAWDAINEAMDVVGEARESVSACVCTDPLEPIPIYPLGMRVVKEMALGSTWDIFACPNIDDLHWLLSGQESDAIPPAAEEFDDPNEPLPIIYSSTIDVNSDARHRSRGAASSHEARSLDNSALVKPEKWDDRFQELLKFKEEFGHCLVPHRWAQDKVLARWVKRQRYQFKLKAHGQCSTLTEKRRQALEKVGFVWSSHHAIWDEKLQELKEFTRRHGHANVPSKYPQNRQLSIWVRSQRRQYKLWGEYAQGKHRSSMTKERYHQLRDLGFDFNPRRL
jgi:Helicase associated domain